MQSLETFHTLLLSQRTRSTINTTQHNTAQHSTTLGYPQHCKANMTQYPPQDNAAGGNNYGYSQGSSSDYYQGQPPSYGQQPPQYGQQPPQHSQYSTPGPQEYGHSPQPGYQPSPQPSHQQPFYGNDPSREHAPAQSYYGTNEQAYQQYPHDRPAQQYGSDYSHQGPTGGNYPPQHQPQQYGGGYDSQQQYPPQPTYGSSSGAGYDQNYRQDPSQPPHSYSNPQYGAPGQTPYGAPQPGAEDRGLMGALAGGAAGGFAGHKANHGFLGTIGGAVAGSMLEDAYKDKKHKKPKKEGKKEKKHKKKSRRGSSSSSSSSSSDSDSGESSSRPHALAGNYSASSRGARLEDDGRTLVAECRDTNGHHCESRIDLNACLTNTNGSLRWARGGNFRPSARDVRLVDGGRVLEAELGDGRGGWVRDHVRLDERIENSNGRLAMI
jgi:hypothetical protein